MNCREYRKKISLIIDGELSDTHREALWEHLSLCRDCHAFYERMGALGENLQSLALRQPAPGLTEKVKERIADERGRPVGTAFFPTWSLVPLMLVAVLAALGLGNLAGQSLSEILVSNSPDEVVEYLLPDQSTSLAAVLTEAGSEENGL